jgi:ketosteroid isomerase-like protein
MQPSDAVRETMLRFYDRISASDAAAFDELVSGDAATLVIGTAPGEWITERPRLRYGFEAEGLRMEPGPAPQGYAEGPMGWFVDEPTYVFPGDSRHMHTRLTAVLRREDERWKVVHMHVSVGVPDEEVSDLQERWATD